MPASSELQKFLQQWWSQKDSAIEYVYPISNRNIVFFDSGLCASIDAYYTMNDVYDADRAHKLNIELRTAFLEEGLHRAFPFEKDENGEYPRHLAYFEEAAKKTSHLNPMRRAWVEKHMNG